VTSYDAFQYLAREFDFRIFAIEGVTKDDQPSSKKIADLIKTIRSEGVKAVFFESIENPKVIGEIMEVPALRSAVTFTRRRTRHQSSINLFRDDALQHCDDCRESQMTVLRA
jgi:substrate-binding protein of zinc uptake complex component A